MVLSLFNERLDKGNYQEQPTAYPSQTTYELRHRCSVFVRTYQTPCHPRLAAETMLGSSLWVIVFPFDGGSLFGQARDSTTALVTLHEANYMHEANKNFVLLMREKDRNFLVDMKQISLLDSAAMDASSASPETEVA
ncbi:hypothetical protein VNO77_30870 [Canavalia gladiata]|uniref:Uncharacterized protein n=1 Tax=Canavalia gladiata TaxID=3824 RepID=A0AAN9KNT6_CANGL